MLSKLQTSSPFMFAKLRMKWNIYFLIAKRWKRIQIMNVEICIINNSFANFPLRETSVTYAIWQVWTHCKIGKVNMWVLLCNVCIDFLNSQIWKESMLELNVKPSSVTTFFNWFCLPYLVFWNLFEFSVAQITLKSISPTLSKSYQINSIESCSWRSFQQHQRHIPIPPKFSATISFNFQWRNHSIFKDFHTASSNIMEPSQCTSPPGELSKETKNTIWSILVLWISSIQTQQTN